MGGNASVEHIEPKSRFASRIYDASNVHWVAKDINLMKRNLTIYEFLATCKKVLQNFGYYVTREGADDILRP